jgi:hypothetical protein
MTKATTAKESYKKTMFVDGMDADGFHLGCKENFRQVLGDNKLYWLIPIFTRYELI